MLLFRSCPGKNFAPGWLMLVSCTSLCGVTICICLCISTVTRAQMHGFSFSLADSMPLLAQHIYVDPFGNRYWISPQGIFFKQDIHTDSLYQYSNWNAGIPEQADVGNPLQVLLFYPISARIYFLSRWLTPYMCSISSLKASCSPLQ